MPLVLPFPDIDPVLVSFRVLGIELALRWYALAYIAGLLLGWRYVAALCRRPALWGGTPAMRPEQADDLLTWMIAGVILGGRLGYVLFYQPGYFGANPGEILAVWHGGMSFHGGLLGVAAGVVGFSLRNGLEILKVGDAVAAAAPIGLFFGRVANFINAELWGRPSTAPWAVAFPGEAAQTCPDGWVGPCARHPSQLYEAGLEGLVLFAVLAFAIRGGALARPGRVFGLFLIGYGLARIIVERFRQADGQLVTAGNPHGHVLGLGGDWGLTMGQLLTLPMLAAGAILIVLAARAGVTALGALIRRRIAEAGPMRLDAYMALCVGHPQHGYYATRDPLGAGGDFVTAPEISQMFGELVGAWTAQVWLDQGRPAPFVLAELGPGRGTLMRDALRATTTVAGFRDAAAVWLVETSPALRARQAATLEGVDVRWAGEVAALPEAPSVVIANEFLDALPIRQFQRADALWRERLVGIEGDGLGFVWGAARPDAGLDARFPLLADGGIAEVNAAAEAVIAALGARIARAGGAALLVDYGGWEGSGDTLQAVAGHAPADPLAAPGAADLTAHVRFRPLAEAARPVRAHGPVPQGIFLERLGITGRARALARGREGPELEAIVAAHRRLTHPAEMGHLIQVLALAPEDAPPPPGFDA